MCAARCGRVGQANDTSKKLNKVDLILCFNLLVTLSTIIL